MDTYEGPSEEEMDLVNRMKHISDDFYSGTYEGKYKGVKYTGLADELKTNNIMSTDGELKQWQRDIMNDPVNHPSHYTDGKIEVIDFIEDKKLGFHLGNAVKYISRAGKKDPAKTVEDLEKAIWYIKRFIEDYKEKSGLNIRDGYFFNCGDTDGDEAITKCGGKDNEH